MKHWTFNEKAEQTLKAFLNICSPSSMEMQTAGFLRREWSRLGFDVKTDVLGNVYGTINPHEEFTLSVVSHIDVVSVQITKVLDNGMLLFRRVGTQLCSLVGQRVTVISGGREITGIIGFDTLAHDNPGKELSEDDLWIDIGASSEDEAHELIHIGDFAVFQPGYSRMGADKICASGLDDRIGLFIINEVMKQLARQKLNIAVCAVGSVQEEIGLRGASVIGSNKRIDACIVVDVDFATDIPAGKDKILGQLMLGKGVGICKKATNNPVLQSLIVEFAGEQKYPCQINLGRNIRGGTDADALQTQLSGIATANISIPCRYMHSANEVCDIKDVESAVNLMVNFIQMIDKSNRRSFIPGIDG
jgi:endoglucanase